MASSTPEQQERIAKDMAANRAKQDALTRKERIEAGEFSLDLMRTANDPPENDPEFQNELSRFGAALRDAGIPYSQTAVAFDAIDAHGYPLPEFIIAMKVLGPAAIAALATAAGAWIQARYGRKARLKIGDIEAEARTPEEIKGLLQLAKQFQADNSPDGKASMNALKEPEHISLPEGLALLESHLSIEQAKTSLRQAFIRGVLGESPRFAFEYDEADIDWVTGSVKLPRKPDRFCPSFLRAEFNAYFFKEHSDPAAVSPPAAGGCKVFVVHGHDEGAVVAMARFLEKIEIEPIVLQEQPDQGFTIIEKFETYAKQVGFAVVLLTPDDLGGSASASSQSARARQNVIFELGYFVGKLGRGRACLLRKGEIEIPSDLYGVIYTEMDAGKGWKLKLAKELKAAEIPFNQTKVMDA